MRRRSPVLVYVLLSLAAVLVIVLLWWAVRGRDRTDETSRFLHARELTTSWSRGEADPLVMPPAEAPEGEARDTRGAA
jgi:hypothetical protein